MKENLKILNSLEHNVIGISIGCFQKFHYVYCKYYEINIPRGTWKVFCVSCLCDECFKVIILQKVQIFWKRVKDVS